ncbi:hypothetical protein R5R35_000790 [Gryllus longicercus]|uniref:Uncharacterized protein n=1 Tax=Gryllus longicercus TaxID=2509291 RepID=A0AAN9Z9D7_9ORTH
MDKWHEKEENKKRRHQEIPVESISEESVLLQESEDGLNNFQALQEEILLEAEREIPDLEDDEEVFTGVMARVLAKLSLEEQPLYLELTPKNIDEKVEKALTEDLENCALLVDWLSVHIKKQREYKKQVDQRRKTLSNIVQNIENFKVENPEDDLRNIQKNVHKKFIFLRQKLSDLIEEWGGDYSSEITDIFAALTQAHLEDTGPAGEGNYVEVRNFRRDVVQFLLSSRLVVWDKDQERIKLSV